MVRIGISFPAAILPFLVRRLLVKNTRIRGAGAIPGSWFQATSPSMCQSFQSSAFRLSAFQSPAHILQSFGAVAS